LQNPQPQKCGYPIEFENPGFLKGEHKGACKSVGVVTNGLAEPEPLHEWRKKSQPPREGCPLKSPCPGKRDLPLGTEPESILKLRAYVQKKNGPSFSWTTAAKEKGKRILP